MKIEILKMALRLSRTTLQSFFYNTEIPPFDDPEFFKPAATFITLKINKKLRGCIGNLEPFESLYESIIRNSKSAAFSDPRFTPLTTEELEEITIEISILLPKKEIVYKNRTELLEKIRPKIDGLFLSYHQLSATFLPQVWEEFDSKEAFLSKLCLKAGLEENDWKKLPVKIESYQVDRLSEPFG